MLKVLKIPFDCTRILIYI